MKNGMRLALWVCIALSTQQLTAQETGFHVLRIDEEPGLFNDTIVLKLENGDKVLFIGYSMKKMIKYERADSLKTLFLADLDKAYSQQVLSMDAQTVHYFVHPSGKRRIKADNADYSANKVDIEYEKKRLNLDLPRYQYFIHDMYWGYELQVFVADPAQLAITLGQTNLTAAIQVVGRDKKEFKRSYKTELKVTDGKFEITDRTHGHYGTIEIAPSFGMGLLGNTIMPVLGGDLWMHLSNKYSVRKHKLGFGITAYPFVRTLKDDVADVAFVHSYDLKYLFNINSYGKGDAHWLGLQGGFMNANKINTYDPAYKIGLLYEGSELPFSYSFDYIFGKGGNTFYGLTIKLPF